MLPGYSIEKLEQTISYTFKDRSLILTALTHSSCANERKINKVEHYERMEFLGDAVLELVSSEYLFHNHPEMPEGALSKRRAAMVCEPALAYCARDIDLPGYIELGRGEEMTGGRNRDSIISDVMEAVVGAIYLDSGFAQAKAFIDRFILADQEEKILFYDAKTILQEEIQSLGKELSYVLVGEEGPEHRKIFKVNALVDGNVMGQGEGSNKKSAQQQAAYEALKKIRK